MLFMCVMLLTSAREAQRLLDTWTPEFAEDALLAMRMLIKKPKSMPPVDASAAVKDPGNRATAFLKTGRTARFRLGLLPRLQAAQGTPDTEFMGKQELFGAILRGCRQPLGGKQ